jgi:undecaprenyl-diphosphatase
VDIIEAIILGLTQGLTEFLPISSSGHLILVPWLFDWESKGLAFDASLHLGTLVAVFVYFWRDILAMISAIPVALRSPIELLRHEPLAPKTTDDPEAARRRAGKLGLLIVLGSIPGGVFGLAGEDRIDSFFHDAAHETRAILAVAVLLILFALILLLAERMGARNRRIFQIGVPDALAIGTAQAVALLPGVSRSGVTLTAGLFRGLQRADAARFSFLLGIPLVTVAGLTSLVDILQAAPDAREIVVLAAAILSAAISGLAAIWGLLRFLQRSSTRVFIVYRVVVGVAVLLTVASGIR